MSINNITLPGIAVQELYSHVLVTAPGVKPDEIAGSSQQSLSFLGSNQKHVAIIVNDDQSLYLPDDDLQFLIGVLNACKLSMADVALVNIAAAGQLSYIDITEQLQAKTILLFDVAPSNLQMPLQFPDYQVQQFNGQVYLTAPALKNIAADKTEKTKLWTSLKKVFAIG
ncbi:MAG: hypothetical protein JST86_06200 [Bacteroidetes bacterium]|nr:hypothetical protein [Bacteroidota bacterium]